MKRTVIRGSGRYLPPRVVTNEDMTQWMDTSDEWIRQRTGILQRHWVPEAGGASGLPISGWRLPASPCSGPAGSRKTSI